MTAFMVALPASPQVRGVEVAGIEPVRRFRDVLAHGADLRRRGDQSGSDWVLSCPLVDTVNSGMCAARSSPREVSDSVRMASRRDRRRAPRVGYGEVNPSAR